ncbi:branched-chain amino acid ABC transporter permease [Aeromicrobium duanguangcaii]|uniref:Branched-chain amino acid ABC transporter permease n=1 Tax=Aeromicrobium duanguangcaii TaxID=2968086 RepID=A0ABY5KH20_9ACTN|nr:branched-chain amino acid ABC transporter permease [Aeromicrobium duanguangcaii]MCD9153873.1 branched-chain amino acid ABC transporter permease [Aeromicrobium duanguangcaii]MCL3837598.1 branched-chain amino acid ABC transporter permease [Aeromicrobium duanguangcaii]UUI69048.1 branched-chain amino acid ABC transporter permease [Aeromicrobium duanguangcaii]
MNTPRVIERGTPVHRALVGAGLVLTVAAALWLGGLAPFEIGQVTRVMIFAVAIAGLNLATGYVGLLSVGHSAFFGIGAYTTGILMLEHGWQGWATIPVAFAISLVVGLLVGLPALRIRGLYLAMVTLAFAVAFPELVARFDDLTGGASGMTIPRSAMRPPEWTGLGLGEKYVWLFWLSVIVMALTFYVCWCLSRSRYGMAMAAIRQNEIAASASGVNIAVVKTASFGLSGAITGAAGSLFALYMGSLYAEGSFTLMAGITLLIGLVIGGERTVLGPIAGALAVVYVPYYTADIGSGQSSAVLFAVVLLFVIFVAPAGVVGSLAKLLRRRVVFRDPRPELAAGEASAVPTTAPHPEHPLDSTTTTIERSRS